LQKLLKKVGEAIGKIGSILRAIHQEQNSSFLADNQKNKEYIEIYK
jgi:hypothetical protein